MAYSPAPNSAPRKSLSKVNFKRVGLISLVGWVLSVELRLHALNALARGIARALACYWFSLGCENIHSVEDVLRLLGLK